MESQTSRRVEHRNSAGRNPLAARLRIPQLDGPASCAVLLVMIHHQSLGVASGGWLGVDVSSC